MRDMRSGMRPLHVALIVVVVAAAPVRVAAQPKADPGDMQRLFEARYQAWRKYVEDVIHAGDPRAYANDYRSLDGLLYGNAPFRQLVGCGLPAVPYLVVEVPADRQVAEALQRITKTRFHWRATWVNGERVFTVDELPGLGPRPYPLRGIDPVAWLRWWKD